MIHLTRPIAVAKPAQLSHVRVYGRGYVLHILVFNRGITGPFHMGITSIILWDTE